MFAPSKSNIGLVSLFKFVVLLVVEDHVDDGVDVGDVDLAVTVDVTKQCALIIAGSMAMAAATAVDDDVDHTIGVGNGNLSITIHVTKDSKINTFDLIELLPSFMALVGLQ